MEPRVRFISPNFFDPLSIRAWHHRADPPLQPPSLSLLPPPQPPLPGLASPRFLQGSNNAPPEPNDSIHSACRAFRPFRSRSPTYQLTLYRPSVPLPSLVLASRPSRVHTPAPCAKVHARSRTTPHRRRRSPPFAFALRSSLPRPRPANPASTFASPSAPFLPPARAPPWPPAWPRSSSAP